MFEYTVMCCVPDKDGILQFGQIYQIQDHSIDRNKFYYVAEGNVWHLFDRSMFAFIVDKLLHYPKFYLNPRPIIGTELKSYIFLNEENIQQMAYHSDVEVQHLTEPYYINCGDVIRL
jgi:hypothetical protein